MKKAPFILLYILTAICLQTRAQSLVLGSNYSGSDKNFNTCASKTRQISFSGLVPSQAITLRLLPGLGMKVAGVPTFSTGTVNSISKGDTVIFNINPTSTTGILSFIEIADCGTFSSNSITKQDRFLLKNQTIVSESYDVSSAVLVFREDQSKNLAYAYGILGERFERKIALKNTSAIILNGRISFMDSTERTLEKTGVLLKDIRVEHKTSNGTIKQTTVLSVKKEDTLVSIVAQLNGLSTTDSLFIIETVEFIKCGDVNNTRCKPNIYYGCTNTCSELGFESFNDNKIFTTEVDPSQAVKFEYKLIKRDQNPACYVGEDTLVYKITNLGSRVDTIILTLSNGRSNTYLKENNLTFFKKIGTNEEILPYKSITDYGCYEFTGCTNQRFIFHPDSSSETFHFAKLNSTLNKADSIFVRFIRAHKQATIFDKNTDYNTLHNNVFLKNSCKSELGSSSFRPIEHHMGIKFQMYQSQLEVIDTLHGKFVTSIPLQIQAVGEDTPYNKDISRLRLVLKLQAGLKLVDTVKLFSSIKGQSDFLKIDKISYDPGVMTGDSGSYTIDFFFKNDFFTADNSRTYGYRVEEAFRNYFDKLEGKFKATPICQKAAPSNYKPKYSISIYLVPDIYCSIDKSFLIPLSSTSDIVSIKCPGCITPGFNVYSANIERTNIGFEDADNNSHPDFPNMNVKASHPDLKRFMIGDTLKLSFWAAVSDGDALKGFTFASAGFDFKGAALTLEGALFSRIKMISGQLTFNQGAESAIIHLVQSSSNKYDIGIDQMKNPNITKFMEGNSYRADLKFVVIQDLKGVSKTDPWMGMDEYVLRIIMAKDSIMYRGEDGTNSSNAEQIKNNPELRKKYFYWCEAGTGRYMAIGTEWGTDGDMITHNRIFQSLEIFKDNHRFEYQNYCDWQVHPHLFQKVGKMLPENSSYTSDNTTFNAFPYEYRKSNIRIDSIVYDIPQKDFYVREMGYLSIYKYIIDSLVNSKTYVQNFFKISNPNHYKITGNKLVIYPKLFSSERDIDDVKFHLPGVFGNRIDISQNKINQSDDIKIISPAIRLFMKDPKNFSDTIITTDYKIKFYISKFPYNGGKDTILTIDNQNGGDFLRQNHADTRGSTSFIRRRDSIDIVDINRSINENGKISIDFRLNDRDNSQYYAPEYPFIYLSNKSKNVSNVKYINENNIYERFKFEHDTAAGVHGTDRKYTITAQYNCANNPNAKKDSLLIYYGWNCYDYPKSLKEACWYDSTWITFTPLTTGLQTSHYIKANDCKSLDYMVKLKATGTGNVKNMNVAINTLSGYMPSDTLYWSYDSLNFNPQNLIRANLVSGNKVWHLDSSKVADVAAFSSTNHNGTLFLKSIIKSICGTFNATDLGSNINFENYCGQKGNIANPYIPVGDLFTSCTNFTTLQLSQTPSSQCAGSNVTLSASLSPSSSNYSYQWYKGITESGHISYSAIPNSNALSFVAVNVQNGEVYKIEATHKTTGCILSKTHTLSLNTSPEIDLSTASGLSSICQGDSSIVSTNFTENTDYQWYVNNLPITTTNSHVIMVKPQTTTTYKLVASYPSNGCSSEASLFITVYPRPTAQAGADLVVCDNANTQIGMTPVTGVTYSWLPIEGLSQSNIANPRVFQSGTYVLTANIGSCQSSDQVSVIVHRSPAALAGNSRSFLSSDTSIQIGSPAIAGLSYTWAPSIGLNSTTLAQPSVNTKAIGQSQTYILTVTNPTNGCKNSASITLSRYCAVSVNTSDGYASFLCDARSAITLNASVTGAAAPINFDWYRSNPPTTPNFGKVESKQDIHTFTTSEVGTYKVSVTDQYGCTATSNVISVVNRMEIACPGPICSGENPPITVTNFNNISGKYNTQWYDPKDTEQDISDDIVLMSIAKTGYYYAAAITPVCTLRTLGRSPHACDIVVKRSPRAYHITSDRPTGDAPAIFACNDITVTLSVTNKNENAGFPTDVVWNTGQTTLEDVTVPSQEDTIGQKLLTVTESEERGYFVVVIDKETGCRNTSNKISVISPTITIHRYCQGEKSVKLKAVSNFPVDPKNYQWKFNGQPISIADGDKSSVIAQDSGVYTVYETQTGCTLKDKCWGIYENLKVSTEGKTIISLNDTISGNFGGISDCNAFDSLKPFKTDYICLDRSSYNGTLPSNLTVGRFMINQKGLQASDWNPNHPSTWINTGTNFSGSGSLIVDGENSTKGKLIWGNTFKAIHGYDYLLTFKARNIDVNEQPKDAKRQIPEVYSQITYLDKQNRERSKYIVRSTSVFTNPIGEQNPWVEYGLVTSSMPSLINSCTDPSQIDSIKVETFMSGGGAIGRDVAIDEMIVFPIGICDYQRFKEVDCKSTMVGLKNASVVLCPDTKAMFTIENAPAGLTYTWTGQGSITQSGTSVTFTSSTLKLSDPNKPSSYQFDIIVKDELNKCERTLKATAHVMPLAKLSLTAIIGSCNSEFTARYEGGLSDTARSFEWWLNDTIVYAQNTKTFSSTTLNNGDEVIVKVHDLCPVSSQKIVVTQIPTPKVNPLSYCQHAPAIALTAEGSKLLWYYGPKGGTGSAIAPIPTTNSTGSTTYYVSQDNGNCESPRTALKVNVRNCSVETELTAEDCEKSLDITSTLHCYALKDALVYEFKFEGLDTIEATSQNDSLFLGTLNPTLKTGTSYNVSVRAQINNVWGNFGNACMIHIKTDPVGINYVNLEETVSIYPNPNSIGEFYFSKKVGKYTMYNSEGLQVKIGADTDRINTSDLPSGLYIILIDQWTHKVEILNE